MAADPSKESFLQPTSEGLEPQTHKLTVQDVKCFVVLHHSTVLMYGALLESALALLYIIPGLYYLLFTALIPLAGYYAGKTINRRIARSYLLYIIAQTLLRITVMVTVPRADVQAAEILSLLVDILIIRATLMYVNLLRHVSNEERTAILLWRRLKSQLKTNSMEQIDISSLV